MKFSIGVPAYKSKYLSECISSILNQTFSDFELIILNDASPEPIEEIVREFCDNRISYYKNNINVGAIDVVDNWNKCLNLATGEYFMLMGDDDVLTVDYIERFIEIIEKYPEISVYHCESIIIDSNGNRIKQNPSLPEYETFSEFAYQRIIHNRPQFISDFVYNRIKLQNKGGFYKLPLAQMSDDITAFINAKDAGVANIQSPVLFYRQHATTISSTGNEYHTLKGIQEGYIWIINNINTSIPLEFEIRNNIRKSFTPKRISVMVRLFENRSSDYKRVIKVSQNEKLISKKEILLAYLYFIKNKIIRFIRNNFKK